MAMPILPLPETDFHISYRTTLTQCLQFWPA
jgi:hypothetical protein